MSLCKHNFFFKCVTVGVEEGQNEDGKEVLEKLTDLRGKLQAALSDYQVLVQLLLSFFKNVTEVIFYLVFGYLRCLDDLLL